MPLGDFDIQSSLLASSGFPWINRSNYAKDLLKAWKLLFSRRQPHEQVLVLDDRNCRKFSTGLGFEIQGLDFGKSDRQSEPDGLQNKVLGTFHVPSVRLAR